jgi:hypothetical protein
MPGGFKVSCHCGNIRLEVTAELGEVVECNWHLADNAAAIGRSAAEGISDHP